MAIKTIKDATKALQGQFAATDTLPLSLPSEARRMLQSFVDEHAGGIDQDASTEANVELKAFWTKNVGEAKSVAKTGLFVGVLRELRPAILSRSDLFDWWRTAVRPVVAASGYAKAAVDDAVDFTVGCMREDENDDGDDHDSTRFDLTERLGTELLDLYIAHTRGVTDEDAFIAPEHALVAQHVEHILALFGRRQPKALFAMLNNLMQSATTRLQALTLLSSFLRHQTPHLYTVLDTPLVETLLKSLMNDTSTATLSVALTSLIMLLPHIPGSLGPHLPRLFLIYSRLLCWEKFSPLSTEAQKDLVKDDRIEGDEEAGDVGIDSHWDVAKPQEGVVEADTPGLSTYFTYLYGLYPLNFTSYIRKPRRYLKNINFPRAEEFDLDQAVIRRRSEQFRKLHLAHPNFCNLGIDEELADPKWPKSDPADVVADCHALRIDTAPAANLVSPGPPPNAKLPNVPPLLPLSIPALTRAARPASPAHSHVSVPSTRSWRDTHFTAVSTANDGSDSPTLGPQASEAEDEVRHSRKASNATRASLSLDDFPKPGGLSTAAASIRSVATREKDQEVVKEDAPVISTNLAYLQREVALLRSDLNFERWHKAQYATHVGALLRQSVADATAEAATRNLINANRALRRQLDSLKAAREASVRDAALTRRQTARVEERVAERLDAAEKERQSWRTEAEELRRLRSEAQQFRDVLVAAEAKESQAERELEVAKRELEEVHDLKSQLTQLRKQVKEWQYREFEFDRASKEKEVLEGEKDLLEARWRREKEDAQQARRVWADKVVNLEARLEAAESESGAGSSGLASPIGRLPRQDSYATADLQAKLAQLKKAHARLLEKHTDLELEYQSAKSQLDRMRGGSSRAPSTFYRDDTRDSSMYHDTMSGGLGIESSAPGSTYDVLSEYNGSNSDPPRHPYQHMGNIALPVSPPLSSEATLHNTAGLTFKPPNLFPPTSPTVGISRQDSMASRSSSQAPPIVFNRTAPLTANEGLVRGSAASGFSNPSSEGSPAEPAKKRKEKIQPDSQVRVYGRGGAQNIKMKDKATEKAEKSSKGSGGFRGLRNLM